MKFDVVDFYPSISESLLWKALQFATNFTVIDEESLRIIMNLRKSLLFCDGNTWIKKGNLIFDVTMGCKILQIANIPSKAMQCKIIDLISAHKLLQTAAEDIVQLRRSFDPVLNEAFTIASTWGLPRQFLYKREKKTKVYFDEISEGTTLRDSKKGICVTVFLLMMDILSCQLINRFEGMKLVVTSYQVLEPSFLSNASHLVLEV